MASALSTTLPTSSRLPVLGVSGSVIRPTAKQSTPSGTLIRNSQCQLATARMAAAMLGPAAADTATVTAMPEIPRTRYRLGMMKRTRAPEIPISAAPPRPCSTRASTRTGSQVA